MLYSPDSRRSSHVRPCSCSPHGAPSPVAQARCETVRSEMAELGPMSARGMYEEELAALRPRLAAILGEEAAYDSPAEGDWG